VQNSVVYKVYSQGWSEKERKKRGIEGRRTEAQTVETMQEAALKTGTRREDVMVNFCLQFIKY